MNIGIDIDGVLTDFEWFIDYFGVKFLKKRKFPHIIINRNEYSFNRKFNCSSKIEKSFYARYLIWYAIRMPIRENAAETIKSLKIDGNNIYIITARVFADKNNIYGKFMRRLVKRWLKKNKVCYDNIYFVDTKNSSKEKSQLCQKLKLDWFVEDDPSNIIELKKHCKVICISAEYNMNFVNVYRAINFADVFSIIHLRKPLQIINKTDLKNMKPLERKLYFNSVYDTIKSLPFDKNAIQKYKSNAKQIIRIIGTCFKSIFSIYVHNFDLLYRENNVIYVCNHRRSLDIPIAYCLLNNRYARFLAKREYQFTILGIVQKALGTIYVGRDYSISCKESQIIMLQSIINNENIFIFPEGTRNRTDNTLLPFKYGAVKISQMTNRPIVPIVIYKIDKFRYNVTIGKEFKVSIYDDLEDKNTELQNTMENMYINLKDGVFNDNWSRL